ncbi:MAG: HEAT repeat domain-containing protein [Edaphobacter sp.]
MAPALLLTGSIAATAQVAPLAPSWQAGTPPPPVETFAAGLTRRNIPLTEPALLAALKNPDAEIRSLAAAQLAASDDHAALKYMITAFQDERDPQVQVNIAGAATWLGSSIAIEQLKVICRDINQPSTARLDAARYISNKQLPDCFPAIREIARNDQDASVRVLAITAAVSYSNQSDGAQKIAVQALNDLDPTVRITAADSLSSLHATNAIPALQSTLQGDGDETSREHLREAIRVLQLAAQQDKKENGNAK